MIWARVRSWSCFCWLYRASPFLVAKNVINVASVLTNSWCLCVELSLVLLEEDICYDQCILLAKPCSLWPASLWTILCLPNLEAANQFLNMFYLTCRVFFFSLMSTTLKFEGFYIKMHILCFSVQVKQFRNNSSQFYLLEQLPHAMSMCFSEHCSSHPACLIHLFCIPVLLHRNLICLSAYF